MRTEFVSFCNMLVNFDEQTENAILKVLKQKQYKKGRHILQCGHVCNNLFFVESGIVKMSQLKEDKEFIMRFFSEKEMFTEFNSFSNQEVTEYQIIALEDSLITYLSFKDLNNLSKTYPLLNSFTIKLQSMAISKMIQRINEMLIENPYERYHSFLKENAKVIQRINLGDLAAYIGISQVSLSRIRGRK